MPLVPFGEIVLYLPLQTAAGNKGEPAKKHGIWLGTIERTEEAFIGIARGVVKCRTVNRLSTDDRWDKDMVLGMQGAPWEPVLGKKIAHIPVEINDNCHEMDVEDEMHKTLDNDDEGEEASIKLRGGLDKLHISRKAVNKYGPTKGCPACREIEKRRAMLGRLGYNRNQKRRQRIFDEMVKHPQYKSLVDKHEKMKASVNVDLITHTTRGSVNPNGPNMQCRRSEEGPERRVITWEVY